MPDRSCLNFVVEQATADPMIDERVASLARVELAALNAVVTAAQKAMDDRDDLEPLSEALIRLEESRR
jgi:hypothetical protein